MEIDAKDWINDLEKQGNRTATGLAVLESTVASNHEAVMKNSDVRLATIMAGINEIKLEVRGDKAEMLAARRRILAAATSVFCTVLTAAWFAVIEPMQDRIAVLERRVLDVEERTISVHASSDS